MLARDAASLLNHLATAVVVFDAELRVTDANLTAETLLATSAAKLRGISAERLFPFDESFRNAWAEVLRDGRTFTERNISLLRINQEHISVECSVSPWWRAGASPAGVILEMSSNERQHRLHAEENRLLQNQISTTLMQGLAHEVKNPLGGIRGAAQLLERELDDPRQREYTQIIIGEADRLRKLVDRMLGPRGQLQLANHNIHEILEHVRQVVEIEINACIYLHRDYDPSLPDFFVDRDLLVQAYLNLVRNAVQAVNGHGGNITLRTRAQRQLTLGNVLHRLVLRTDIEDDGPGIDPALGDSIFFPMVSGRADGSGLGLPIAQSLVQRHGGLIEFSTGPAKTVFTVWIPVRNSV
ncbi:MAG: PAS domain-containing protein [Gammaproteobacteria bacterium]|nr:PAS domain-containing protein [Gammaproteobacteria bacterium]